MWGELSMIDKASAFAELQRIFSDVVSYDSDDPLAPIDPMTYRTPEGDSCLHLACVRGDLHAVKLLVSLGLDVNSAGDLGNTSLHCASRRGNRELADFLIANGADVGRENEFGAAAGAGSGGSSSK